MEGKEKVNILIFSWRGPGHPNEGGAEISTHEHAKRWVRAGHSVTLFTSYYKAAPEQESLDGVNIIRAGSQFLGVHYKAFFWYLFGNHLKFDLVVDQFHGIPFFTPIYVRVKKLAFIHEVTKEVWKLNQFSAPFNFFAATFGNILEPLIFKLYKRIHFMAASESTKNDLIAFGIPKQNITIVHNGVTISKVTLKKETKNTVVFLGALAKDKGIETALLCMDYFQKKFDNDSQFWIIGRSDSKYLKFLKSKAEAFDLKNTKFWGYLDETIKFQLLARAHILLNPSIREGWGLVVIEAAAVGTPTVAFNVPGLRDSIVNGKTGLLSNELSPEALAEKVISLFTDKKRYKKICQKALFRSKKFSWEKAARESIDLIDRITG